MKILVISYAYYPSINPRAFRWTAIAEEWARNGHEVDVVCEPGAFSKETINGVNLHRTGWARQRRSRIEPTPRPGGQPTSRNLFINVLRSIWRKLYWPDFAFPWYLPATRTARALVKASHYDLMISVSVPFTGHLVGLFLKKLLPGLRWVVDIGDPFSFSEGASANNFGIYSRLNRLTEEAVFRRADAISVTTDGTLERYSDIFPLAALKISMIPPLLSPVYADIATTARLPTDGRIRLVFVGTLYGDIRSPVGLLTWFRRMLQSDLGGRLELHFYGTAVNCELAFCDHADLIGQSVFRHGLVSQAIAAEAMRRCTVLVNIGNATEYQLPSKVIEYAAAAKPVLNFVNSERDSSRRFFSQFAGIETIIGLDWEAPQTFDRLKNFLSTAESSHYPERTAGIAKFASPQIAKRYLEL